MQILPKTNLSPEPTLPTEKIILDVGGMKCAGCVRAVERHLTQYSGVNSVCVNLATEVAVVESQAGVVNPDDLAEKLSVAGFPTQPRKSALEAINNKQSLEDPVERQRKQMQLIQRQLVIAVVLLILSGIGHFTAISSPIIPDLHNIWFHFGLATVALLIPGRPILVDGWRALRQNSPNMNTLIGLGTFTAYTASLVALVFPQLAWECFFDEPVMMLGFILLGKTLEQHARHRAAAAFRQLLALQPQVARLIAPKIAQEKKEEPRASQFVEIPAQQLR
uniref:cation transporter n=1 Tax=Aetokthonos hydrillicola TaxID=1550245 RepID=UPI001ABACE2D